MRALANRAVRNETLLASNSELKIEKEVLTTLFTSKKISHLLCQYTLNWDSGGEITEDTIYEACRLTVEEWLPGHGSADEYVGIRREVWEQVHFVWTGIYLPVFFCERART